MASTASRHSLFARITESRNGLGLLFMLPAAVFLLCFLTYPLGLGVWLGFTDTKIGRDGVFVGLENYRWLFDDGVFWLAVFNTLFYTIVASVLKFGLGLWLALLLNEKLPLKSFFRAIVLLPWVVPTVLSALAFWWIFDSQFSIISWVLMQWGLIDAPINFLGEPWNARWSVIAANVWRGVPFVAISLLAGPADHPAVAARGGGARRRHLLAAVPAHHPAAADADHRRGDDLLGALHLHRLPAHLRPDPRRPGERHPPDGDALLPARASPAASSARARRSRWR